MLFELVGTAVAGLAAAGLMWALNRGLGGRLPRWLIPAAAGLAMLAATISSEYNWYDRTRSNLPEGLEVAQTVQNRAFFRPWTYVHPFVHRFVAVDVPTIKTVDAAKGVQSADLYFFSRWQAPQGVPVLFDCVGHRQAPLHAGQGIETAQWADVAADTPVMKRICGGD